MKLPAHTKMLSAAAAASVLLLTAACGGSDEASEPTTSGASAPAESEAPSASGTYQDGAYEAEGSYVNPGGQSTVAVALTLADNEVTEVEVTPQATNGESKSFQSKFAGGISSEVVGKSLDEIKVDKVAGSSLTHQGFEEALEQIRADARG